ncbi:MAG: hypothetical protein JK586_00300, partial [Nocardiopsis sp. BM-2018]
MSESIPHGGDAPTPRSVVRGARLIDAHGDHGVHDLYLAGGRIEGIDLGGAGEGER